MWRAPLRGFMLVLVVAGVAVLSIGLWARFMVYDEDQFVSVVGGLSTDPVIQEVAVHRTMTEIDRQIEEKTATQALNPSISITYEIFRPQIESGLISALQSPQWHPIWIQALHEIHGPLTDLLKGNSTPNLKQADNKVQINLFPYYEQAETQLRAQGITLLDQINLTRDDLWVTLLEGDTLAQIQEYVSLFNGILAIGIIVSVLAGIAYVLLSSRKLRAMVWLLLAIAVGWLIQRFGLELGRQQLVEALSDENQRNAAKLFYDTLVGDLRTFGFWALIVASLVAIGIFIFDMFCMQKRMKAPDAAV